jgi:predicted glutamine amidotransferase
MCVVIVKPAGRSIPEHYINNAWQSNSDGGGFAYVKDGKVVIEKGLMTLKEFKAALETALLKNKKSVFLIHLRTRTQGAKSEENTQPFQIKGAAFAHNGGFNGTGVGYSATGDSDSKKFADRYGDVMDYACVHDHKKGWEEAVGYNKIALLYDDGRYQIINEKDGSWENDIWYSNMYFKRSYSFGGPDSQRDAQRMLG